MLQERRNETRIRQEKQNFRMTKDAVQNDLNGVLCHGDGHLVQNQAFIQGSMLYRQTAMRPPIRGPTSGTTA